jgi:transposase-like protein
VVVAIDVTTDRARAVLGVAVGPSEDDAGWLTFLRRRLARGLHGAQLVIIDASVGSRPTISASLHGAAWQRGRVPCVRNALAPAEWHPAVGRRRPRQRRAVDGRRGAGATTACRRQISGH